MPLSTPAALLVIDMLQEYFRGGPLGEHRAALVDSLNRLLAEFRSRGLPIIWVRQEFREDLADAFLVMKRRDISITIAGTIGAQILPELARHESDAVVVKKRYSAFFGTDLDQQLAALMPRMLVVSGINTHACVRTTVIDAYQRDMDVVVATDCVGSYDREHHEVTLRYLGSGVAELLSNDAIVARLSPLSSAR